MTPPRLISSSNKNNVDGGEEKADVNGRAGVRDIQLDELHLPPPALCRGVVIDHRQLSDNNSCDSARSSRYMSLVQRVTPLEGTDREFPQSHDEGAPWLRPLSRYSSLRSLRPTDEPLGYGTLKSLRTQPSLGTVRSLRAVVSYDALPKPAEDSQATNPTGGVSPYKVSVARRIAQVIATILSCWLASGIVFGFAALKPVLVDQGVYRELCTPEELADDVEVCFKQDLRLNLFFAIASTTCNVSALPVGTILDRYGPRVATTIGCLCLAVGSLLMALAFQIPTFDGYTAGNVFLALGGTFIFVPSFAIANAFPRYAGMIVATVTGAFDASAAVFLLYRLLYQASRGSFIPEQFFFLYMLVPAAILLVQLTLMNHDAYKTVPQLEEKLEKAQDATRDVHDSDEDLSDREVHHARSLRRDHRESRLNALDKLLGDAEHRQSRIQKIEEHHTASKVWGALHGRSALRQMLSPWFILITLLTVLQMLRMNFVIATINSQYEHMLGSRDAARQINSFFDVALPVGGIAATPFIGCLLDHTSTATVLAILVSLITATGVLSSLPFYWAAYGNVILFVLLRPLYYSAMSDYAQKIFGLATFGRVYGTIICFSGLINLFQPLIDAANHEYFHDNPIPINIIMASLGFVLGTALVAFVWSQGNSLQQEEKTMVEVAERHSLAPVDEE